MGALSLVATDHALVALVWRREATRAPSKMPSESRAIRCCAKPRASCDEYFAGTRRAFDARRSNFVARISSAAPGPRCSPFPTVKHAPIGRWREQIGNPTAVRAVGAANGRNPISIIAPCHRVIGMNGDLTGFGGGLDAKARLLSLEAPQQQLLAG